MHNYLGCFYLCQVTYTITDPEVAFTGDTTSDFIVDENNIDVLRAKILVMEVWYLKPAHYMTILFSSNFCLSIFILIDFESLKTCCRVILKIDFEYDKSDFNHFKLNMFIVDWAWGRLRLGRKMV